LAGLERESLSHALNIKAVARRHAAAIGHPYAELNLVVAHLGTGISVTAHRDGRMVDVTNPRDEGPLGLDRPGALPNGGLVDRCFKSGASRRGLYRQLLDGGGVFSYLGTRDLRVALDRADSGDGLARQVLDAMTYQISKAIGEMATVLEGRVDAILLTGGIAHAEPVVAAIRRRTAWIADVTVYPGEDELQALAEGALRVLKGEEEARFYGSAEDDAEVLI
jgi:butyrate kinase